MVAESIGYREMMTITEAKETIYANVVYACEKAGLAPQTTRLVQDACDTIIAIADACETIVALADRKTEPQRAECPFDDAIPCEWVCTEYGKCKYKPKTEPQTDCNGCKFVGTYDTEFPCANCSRKTKDYYAKDEPQTERSE